jgi:hypothetical protein
MKLTNNWEGRNYIKHNRDMRTGQFKNKVKSFFKKLMFWVSAVLILVGVGAYARWAYPMTEINIRETLVQVDNLGPKIDMLKNEVLDSLQSCESGGSNDDTGLIVFDSNKVASLGLYQFQKLTVIAYYKTLYGKTITGKEALMIALDRNQARKLASDIIFSNDSKGVNNWYNCNKKNGLEAKVAFINKISK